MNTKAESTPGILDTVKLALAVVMLLGGIAGYYYFENESILLRVAGLLVAVIFGAVIAFQSLQGKNLWRFMQSSRNEIRKVIWPTRQETMQTTLTVFVFVLILGIFFWGLDWILFKVTGMLTGQGS
ncbi:MAG: preprotein translocase subunit SecE [Proteobacteria bacterium]|nr:MAG: preprotein translocase subunit SecE [Pseudomonadota bacterium]